MWCSPPGPRPAHPETTRRHSVRPQTAHDVPPPRISAIAPRPVPEEAGVVASQPSQNIQSQQAQQSRQPHRPHSCGRSCAQTDPPAGHWWSARRDSPGQRGNARQPQQRGGDGDAALPHLADRSHASPGDESRVERTERHKARIRAVSLQPRNDATDSSRKEGGSRSPEAIVATVHDCR